MRPLKITGSIVAAIVVVAVLLLLIGFPAGFITSPIQSRIEHATGYRLTTGGSTTIGLWPSPNMTLNDVTLQRPEDSDTRARVTVGRIQANIALASLWSGHPEITNLVVTHPVIIVPLVRERSAPPASDAKEGASGGKDAGALSVDRVTVDDGSIVFFNEHDHVDDRIDGLSADAALGADRNVAITGGAHAGDYALKFDIKATMPKAPNGRQDIPVDLTFEAPGLLPRPLTSTAQARLDGSVIQVNGVTGRLGDDTFNGWASIDVASKPQLKLNLDFQRLSVAPSASRTSNGSQPWSDAPIDLVGLNYVDLQAHISAGQFIFGNTQIEPFATQATLENGNLKCSFEKLGVYGGQANGDLTVDASGSVPSYTLHSDLTDVRALPLLQNIADFDRLDGKLQARLDLHSSGFSQRAIMSNLNGTASLLFQDGAIRGINVAQMIRNLTTNPLSGWQEDNTQATDLAQLSASFRIEKGQAVTDDLNLVGPLVRVTGGGTVDLGKQSLALRVAPKLVMSTEGQGRGSDPLGFGFPVAIDGPWADPRIYIDMDGMLDNPDAAYAKLKQIGKGLFGPNGALNGLGGLLGGNGANSGSGNDNSLGDSLGQTLGTMIQQGLQRWRDFSSPPPPASTPPPPSEPSAPDQNEPAR
jgi:AsmA protein